MSKTCEEFLESLLKSVIMSCKKEDSNNYNCDYPYGMQCIPGFPSNGNFSCEGRNIVHKTNIQGNKLAIHINPEDRFVWVKFE